VVGYAGLLDLGYAAFFATAPRDGLLNSPVLGSPLYGYPWSFWVCIWIAAAVSGAPRHGDRRADPAVCGGLSGDHHARVRRVIPVAIRNLGDIHARYRRLAADEALNLTGARTASIRSVAVLAGVPFETDPCPGTSSS